MRGNRQSESHGGVFVVDFEKQEVEQLFDWNESEIDLKGSSGDRDLRGIAFNDEEILAAPGFDSLLAYDLDTKEYVWGFHLLRQYGEWVGHKFDPRTDKGPLPVNEYHINMVHVDNSGIYLGGMRTNALLHLNNKMEVSQVCSLPAGAHNARPYRDGLLFNDTESNCIRYVGRDDKNIAFKIATYDEGDIEFADTDDSNASRQGFGRGLCTLGDRFVAGGLSPATISLYDLESEQKVGSVNLTMDITFLCSASSAQILHYRTGELAALCRQIP